MSAITVCCDCKKPRDTLWGEAKRCVPCWIERAIDLEAERDAAVKRAEEFRIELLESNAMWAKSLEVAKKNLNTCRAHIDLHGWDCCKTILEHTK